MLFEKDWDLTLISQYSDLKDFIKPIITTYPYDFSFDENSNPTFNKPSGKSVLVLRPRISLEKDSKNKI
jgi:hypothetical protein